MMNDTVENWALHAFADGELEGEEKRKVEVFLRDNPDARHVLTDIAAQKAALHRTYDGILSDPIPSDLLKVARSLPQSRNRWSMAQAAAAAGIVALLVGGAGGWFLHPAGQTVGESLADTSLDNYQVYATDFRHPVEVAASDKDHLQMWLSKRIGVKFSVPDLQDKGYTLLGGRLLADNGKPAGLLVYEDANKQRMSVFFAANDARNEAPMMVKQRGNVVTCYWVESDMIYAVAGEQPTDTMVSLANAVHEGFDKT